jgi:hydrogenase maturation protein HypF
VIDVRGTVQGVGFRPFVYRLATELHLDGTVRNAGGHVIVEAAGSERAVDDLIRRLTVDAPPLAHITSVSLTNLAVVPQPGSGFHVAPSDYPSTRTPAVSELPPDIAICDDCLRELHDPSDRRFRYAFINCTNCGPRATIIDDLPYDRARTVMRKFPLCASCAADYSDPADRRFHAEPIACTHCGPELAWRSTGSASVIERGSNALETAVRAIANGSIVAIKGLGGYQLVCDATRSDVVALLRQRKHRSTKPLAVMVRDLDALLQIATPTPDEVALLTSTARPIVLVRSRGLLPAAVHPATDQIGVFLPYTPLHDLLLADLRQPSRRADGRRQ